MVRIGLGHAANGFHAVLYGHTIEHRLVSQLHATVNTRIEARVARPGVHAGHKDGELSGRAYSARNEQRKVFDGLRSYALDELGILKI